MAKFEARLKLWEILKDIIEKIICECLKFNKRYTKIIW